MYLVLFILFTLIITISLSRHLTTKEAIDSTIPVSFPRVDTLQMPRNVVEGNIQVQGPVVLGIEGSDANITYIETNQTNLFLNSAGYDSTSDAVIYTDTNGLTIDAANIYLNGEVNTGPLTAGVTRFNTMKVNRTDSDPYVNGWGSGVHTWDLYANGTVGVGKDGEVVTSMNSGGDIWCKETAYLNQVYGQNLKINNDDILAGKDQLMSKAAEIRRNILKLHRDLNERNRLFEIERLRKIAEEIAAEARRRAEAAWNAVRRWRPF